MTKKMTARLHDRTTARQKKTAGLQDKKKTAGLPANKKQ